MKSDKKLPNALVFDAYGTLIDVRSVITGIEQKFPGMGPAVSSRWRAKRAGINNLRTLHPI
jgi:2-haloacid dehalogenase